MTKFLQLVLAGLVLGSIYGLVAMGFSIVYKATKVVHFAHGAVMALGAYLTYQFSVEWHVPWPVAVVLAVVVCAAVNVALQRIMLPRMLGRPIFAAIMVTFGFDVILRMALNLIWRGEERPIGDPWGASTVEVFGITTTVGSVWTLGVASVCMLGVFLFFRYTKLGLQMLGTASDQEAALISGVPVSRTFGVAWALAGALAVIAGVASSMFPRALSPDVATLGLRAFPAAILGGLDSPHGVIVGGIAIGLVEVFVAGYLSGNPVLGGNFSAVSGYLLMIVVLLVRPYGLFGTKEVVRV